LASQPREAFLDGREGEKPEPARGDSTLESILEIRGEEKIIEVKNPWAKESWEFHLIPRPLCLPKTHCRFILEAIEEWKKRFPREETLAWEWFETPSLICRVDYSFTANKISLYEIEDSPAGIGLANLCVPGFKEKLRRLSWRKVVVLINPKKRLKGGDDHLWTKVVGLDQIKEIEDCWIAPRLNFSEALAKLKEKSIWPLKFRKSKLYGRGWLWQEIKVQEMEKFVNWAVNKEKWEGVVFKSDGSKSQMIRIWLPSGRKKEAIKWLKRRDLIGTWTMKAIRKDTTFWPSIYAQKFFWPVPLKINEKHMFGIFRIYVGFNTERREWQILGGWLNARPSLLVHGASDAIFVPITSS